MQRIFCKNLVHWGAGNKEDDQQKHGGFLSVAKMYDEYKRHSIELALSFVGLTKFSILCKEKKITVYSPKKDLCDKCLAYKNKQISPDEYNSHIDKKNLARVIFKFLSFLIFNFFNFQFSIFL